MCVPQLVYVLSVSIIGVSKRALKGGGAAFSGKWRGNNARCVFMRFYLSPVGAVSAGGGA